MDEQPRKRGRPKGSRNKPVLQRRLIPPPANDFRPGDDYKHADIDTIIARQISLVDWAQQACRNELLRAYQAKGLSVSTDDLERLETLTNTIVRSVDALKKSSDLAGELASRMSPEQLLEAALKKVEGQDQPTIKYAIKRLRAHLERIGPVTFQDRQHMQEITGSGAIASLKEDE